MVSEPSTAVYQIQARDRITQEIAYVNLTIAFSLCPLDSMLLEVAQTSHLNSGTEQWKLLLLSDSSNEEEEEEEVLGEGRGVDCGPSTLQISQFFCLPPGRQLAIQRRIDPQGAASRMGRLTLRSHLPFRASERAWSTLAQLEFDVCATEWSGEVSTFGLDECATFRFASSLLLSRTSEWSLNTNSKVDYSWFEEDFEEDWRWRTATMDSIEQPGTLHLRRWFDAAKRDWEAIDLLFANTGAVWAALNGEYLFDRVCSPRSVVTVRISADRLREGRNLLAIQFSRSWTQSNEAQSVLLRAVYSREPLWVGEELVSMSASSSIPDFYPLLAIDGDPSTLWKGRLENGFAVLKASFHSALAMGISAYCITASPSELETAPTRWKVRVQSADLVWRALQTQNSVWFAHRGEKRCFPVTDRAMQSRVLIAVEFLFLGNAWQTEVSIAELQVKTMAFDRVERPAFLYPQDSVPFVLGVDFPRIENHSCQRGITLLPRHLALASDDADLIRNPFPQHLEALHHRQSGVVAHRKAGGKIDPVRLKIFQQKIATRAAGSLSVSDVAVHKPGRNSVQMQVIAKTVDFFCAGQSFRFRKEQRNSAMTVLDEMFRGQHPHEFLLHIQDRGTMQHDAAIKKDHWNVQSEERKQNLRLHLFQP